MEFLKTTENATTEEWINFPANPPNSDWAKTRDFFHKLVTNNPASSFEEYKNHSFWKNWRSRADTTNILHFAISQSKDYQWVETLIKEISPVPHVSYMTALANRHSQHTFTLFNIFKKMGFWVDDPSFLVSVSRSGSWRTAQALLESNDYPNRVPMVENVWLSRRKKIKESGEVSPREILEFFWKKWGIPDSKGIAEMMEACPRPNQVPWHNGYDFLLEHSHGLNGWTDRAAGIFIVRSFYGNEDTLLKAYNKGWVFTEQAWSIARKMLFPYGPQSEASQVFDVIRSKLLLEREINGDLVDEPSSRKKKM